MKADLHFHTTISDGRDAPEKVLQNLQTSGVSFATLTDHDHISDDFADELQRVHIETVPASEISTHFFTDDGTKIPLHMTAYALGFDSDARDMLQQTREGKAEKVRQQVIALIEKGYEIDYEGLLAWAQEKGYNKESFNNAHLSSYIYSVPVAAEKGDLDQKRSKPDRVGFLMECLRSSGRNPIGAIEIPEYEPTTEKAAAVVKNMGGIISIAHPNFSWERYGGIPGLQRDIAKLVDQGVMGIELNALAKPEWVKVILEIQKRYGLLLTFGSDNHGETKPSEKHAALGDMNPYFLEDEARIAHHLNAFKKKLGIS